MRKNSVKRRDASRLTRDDWLDAAFGAVVEGGFENVRVLAIADTLGVTRGSFYWHFADHAELISALLARWREREAESIRRLHAESTPDAREDLERLLEESFARPGPDAANMRFELALRGLERRDPAVAKMLLELDRARADLLGRKFRRLTANAKSAAELATLFCLTIAGARQALASRSSDARQSEYLRAVIAKRVIPRPATRRAGGKPASKR
jgi:AcrR family transcriptional regulator